MKDAKTFKLKNDPRVTWVGRFLGRKAVGAAGPGVSNEEKAWFRKELAQKYDWGGV
jgi:hypothetical protein